MYFQYKIGLVRYLAQTNLVWQMAEAGKIRMKNTSAWFFLSVVCTQILAVVSVLYSADNNRTRHIASNVTERNENTYLKESKHHLPAYVEGCKADGCAVFVTHMWENQTFQLSVLVHWWIAQFRWKFVSICGIHLLHFYQGLLLCIFPNVIKLKGHKGRSAL